MNNRSEKIENENRGDRKILLIGDVDVERGQNHRFFHLARMVSEYFGEVHFVSYRNAYGGPPAAVGYKIRKAFANLVLDRKKVYRVRNIEHIIVRRLKMPNLLDQLFQGMWIFLNVRKNLEAEYDVCIFGHPYNFLLATILKRIGKARTWIYDDWDYFPGYSHREGRAIQAIAKFQERISLKIPELVISVSDQLSDLRRRQGVKRVEVIPNGVDAHFFEESRLKAAQHPPTVVYVGTVSFDWGVDIPIKSIPYIRTDFPDVRLLIVGSGPDDVKMKEIAERLGVGASVVFMGARKYEDLPTILRSADIGAAMDRNTKFRQFASPLKIRDYAAAGLPVITTGVGEAKCIVEQYHIGRIIEQCPRAFAKAAIDLFKNEEYNGILQEERCKVCSGIRLECVVQKQTEGSIYEQLGKTW